MPSNVLSACELSKSFGNKPLFTGITFAVGERERLALIGPNGSGKSTLLRMLAGLEDPDQGEVRLSNDLRVAYVAQEDKFDEALTIAQVLTRALSAAGYDEHDVEGKVEVMSGRVGFADKNAPVATLSGGGRKRLAIARGLIVEPELLLLDEPTNHLDIEGVLWLEAMLEKATCALLFVSHDRYFIERVAERVIEINRRYPRGFFSADGGYADFLEAREAYFEGLQQTKASLANRVRREVAWLRQGAKARSTKSKHRTETAGRMIDELKNFNLETRDVSLEFAASKRKSKDLIKLENIGKSFGERRLFGKISLTISPGVRLGVVGANGSGKTTFMRTLLGEIKPDEGKVIRAANLRVAYFDQARRLIDPALTLKEALCPEGDGVVFQGKLIHVVGWAERFLFTRDHLSIPVGQLSGGEQARVLLAKVMLQETDLIFFDEPTNDLDIHTLEVMEESFCDYPGAIVLVTHDRYLLDRTATLVLGIGEESGGVYGDYLQWERAREERRAVLRAKARAAGANPAVESAEKKRNKLSYNEQRELGAMEKNILAAEERMEKLQQESLSEAIMCDAAALQQCYSDLAAQQVLVEKLYDRWAELEALQKRLKGE